MSALDPRQLTTALGLLGIVTASAIPIGLELLRRRSRALAHRRPRSCSVAGRRSLSQDRNPVRS
jgi:hypothetical protein